jgi:hypothetical protein
MPFLLPQPGSSTVPDAPSIGTATAGNTTASVPFTPNGNGGSPILDFTATSTPGSITGTGASSPVTVNGLTNGQSYTFTVHARNAIGNSAESGSSNSVTPNASAPSAPVNPIVFTDYRSAWVIFGGPSNIGGSALTQYTAQAYTFPGGVATGSCVTSTPNGANGGLSCLVLCTGLADNTQYTIRVRATNSNGTSAESADSSPFTTKASGDYYVAQGNSPSASQPQNTAWQSYNSGYTFNDTGHVFPGETNSVLVPNIGSYPTPYPLNIFSNGVFGDSGMWNMSAWGHLIFKVFCTAFGGTSIQVNSRHHNFVFGQCTAGSGANVIVDSSKNFTANTLGGGGTSAIEYIAGASSNAWSTSNVSSNTATQINVTSRTWSVGDYYCWSQSDQDFNGGPFNVAQYVTQQLDPTTGNPTGSQSPGVFVNNVWNVVAVPYSAMRNVPSNPNNWVTGTLQEFMLINGTGASVWFTDVGFSVA